MADETAAVVAMGVLMAFAHVVAIVLAIPFLAQNLGAFPEPDAVTNALIYFLLILGFTAVILLIIRWKRENWLRYLILGALGLTMLFVFQIPFTLAFAFLPALARDLLALGSTVALTVLLLVALARNPEWYFLNVVGVAVAIGATALIGISFGILPALLLLIALAAYDAWAVYRTKHMLTLADAVTELRLPILLVIPKRFPYSMRAQPRLKDQLAEGEERGAMFMGLGDIIIPGILVVSAFANLSPEASTLVALPNFLVALGTLAGALVGFAVLMRFVLTGRPQAGLPLLNSGAILGYLLSYLLVYGDLSFGITIAL